MMFYRRSVGLLLSLGTSFHSRSIYAFAPRASVISVPTEVAPLVPSFTMLSTRSTHGFTHTRAVQRVCFSAIASTADEEQIANVQSNGEDQSQEKQQQEELFTAYVVNLSYGTLKWA